jgi:hypothetical protein
MTEIGGNTDWSELDHDRVDWRTFVFAVLNFQVLKPEC